MNQYNIKNVNKIIEQYEIKLSQLTRENVFLNAAVNELQDELVTLKEEKNKDK